TDHAGPAPDRARLLVRQRPTGPLLPGVPRLHGVRDPGLALRPDRRAAGRARRRPRLLRQGVLAVPLRQPEQAHDRGAGAGGPPGALHVLAADAAALPAAAG